MTVIKSVSNRRIKELRRLKSDRGRRRGGLAVLEGPVLIRTALAAGVKPVIACYHEPRDPDVVDYLAARGAELMPVTANVLAVVADTDTPQGVVAVVHTGEHADVNDWWRAVSASACLDLIVVVDEVQDPGNLGTIIRTARAAGAGGVVVSGDGADPFSPRALRAAAGWTFHLPVVRADWKVVVSLLRRLGLQLIGTVPSGGLEPWRIDLRPPSAVIVGNEANGLAPGQLRKCDHLLSIPMAGGTESLNVSQAAAIVMYELGRQRMA